ncbi:MAG: riboflavin biosynthesis protein RibD [Chloroflexi bacterium]|nr:riboflavin biosynthesis protein RibD [Chloroflexota bacterium]|tara:strand:- start:10524 stop:11606 length:1083 start_codon:yes stop_codon:yes gene_type:complete
MDFLELALDQAKLAVGLCYPNPAVGAVVVKNNVIIGSGYTQKPGQSHAEIMALENLQEASNGATLYVTLEPCSHTGKTPPCVDKIISSGITKVVYGIEDPNPKVSSYGIKKLQDANITVEKSKNTDLIKKFYEAYIHYHKKQKPFISAKFAASLDGKIATASGESKWITNEFSRNKVHEIRSASDVIIVGINTILKDNPLLTARKKDGNEYEYQPLKVVIDSNCNIPIESNVMNNPTNTLIAYNQITEDKKNYFEQKGIHFIKLPKENKVDINELINFLYSKQKYQILIEGGSEILGSFFNLHLIDKVYAFIAPILIGGQNTPSAIGGLGAETMSDIIKLKNTKIEKYDSDLLLTGYPNR